MNQTTSNMGCAGSIRCPILGWQRPWPRSMLVPRLQVRRRLYCQERSLAASADREEEMTMTKLALAHRIPDGRHNVCPGPIVGNGAAHRTHASGPTPLPSRTMLVGGRQARL